jgi:polyphosphate kinase
MAAAEHPVRKGLDHLRAPKYLISRELSWLEFNRRVLSEALDERTPLLEALKFLAIFSSNLDEYFMVRVAALKQQIEAHVNRPTPEGLTPKAHLQAISAMLRPMVTQQHDAFVNTLRKQMAEYGVYLLDYADLDASQKRYLHNYFQEQIFPVLTPLAVDPGHPFPYISNLSLNLAVVVQDVQANHIHFARVKVPRVLPRFIDLPIGQPESIHHSLCHWQGVPIEQVIAHNLEQLFPGMVIKQHYVFRITRNADLSVEEDEADDLMLAIEQELRKRRLGGSAVRMEIQSSMPEQVRQVLMQEIELTQADVYDINGILGLGDLFTLTNLSLPELKLPDWTPTVPPAFEFLSLPRGEDADLTAENAEKLFTLLRHHDQLLHHPYHSFAATVQRFITQAAHDPYVLAIKMTLYRTSGNSPIISSLISAAENGKQVVVLVELKARFDEENNINWARQLEKSGVHVVYGLVGLKTHTKVVLVVRREGHHIRRYCHVGTGNYNPKTARLYTDLGLLSGRDEIGADITDLFNYLTGYSRQQTYRKLLVAPLNLRQKLTDLIDQEIDYARRGQESRIIAKMNSLVDTDLIARLYQASQAGVTIDLIVRGICCLRPGLEGISDNIRVVSIIGRFLEHSRLYYFHHGGKEIFLMGSADWMPRNLDRRVEVVVPVEDPSSRKELKQILDTYRQDNRQAWDLQSDGSYLQRKPGKHQQLINAQQTLMARYKVSLENGSFPSS